MEMYPYIGCQYGGNSDIVGVVYIIKDYEQGKNGILLTGKAANNLDAFGIGIQNDASFKKLNVNTGWDGSAVNVSNFASNKLFSSLNSEIFEKCVFTQNTNNSNNRVRIYYVVIEADTGANFLFDKSKFVNGQYSSDGTAGNLIKGPVGSTTENYLIHLLDIKELGKGLQNDTYTDIGGTTVKIGSDTVNSLKFAVPQFGNLSNNLFTSVKIKNSFLPPKTGILAIDIYDVADTAFVTRTVDVVSGQTYTVPNSRVLVKVNLIWDKSTGELKQASSVKFSKKIVYIRLRDEYGNYRTVEQPVLVANNKQKFDMELIPIDGSRGRDLTTWSLSKSKINLYPNRGKRSKSRGQINLYPDRTNKKPVKAKIDLYPGRTARKNNQSIIDLYPERTKDNVKQIRVHETRPDTYEVHPRDYGSASKLFSYGQKPLRVKLSQGGGYLKDNITIVFDGVVHNSVQNNNPVDNNNNVNYNSYDDYKINSDIKNFIKSVGNTSNIVIVTDRENDINTIIPRFMEKHGLTEYISKIVFNPNTLKVVNQEKSILHIDNNINHNTAINAHSNTKSILANVDPIMDSYTNLLKSKTNEYINKLSEEAI
jgi:hypothetical protein